MYSWSGCGISLYALIELKRSSEAGSVRCRENERARECCMVTGWLSVQDYSVSMYLRQNWRDQRLGYRSTSDKSTEIRLGEGTTPRVTTRHKRPHGAAGRGHVGSHLGARHVSTQREARQFPRSHRQQPTGALRCSPALPLLCRRDSFHEVTVSNRLLRLNSTGYLWYVIK